MDGNDEGSAQPSALVTVNMGTESTAAAPDLMGKVHQMPCCIKHDGPIPVSHYLKPKTTEMEVDGLKVEEAYFRGRNLQGTTVALPYGYSSFILGKKGEDQGTDGTNSPCWETTATFQDITHSCAFFIGLLLPMLCIEQ